MADLNSKNASPSRKITGGDEAFNLDVFDISGKKGIRTDATLVQSPTDTPGCPVVSNKLKYEVDRTTVVLTTSYQTIWSYTGSGKFGGIICEFESNLTDVKFIIDSTEVVFEFQLIDLMSTSGNKEFSIGSLHTDATGRILVFTPGPELCPIYFASKVELQAKTNTGKKKYGFVVGLTKET